MCAQRIMAFVLEALGPVHTHVERDEIDVARPFLDVLARSVVLLQKVASDAEDKLGRNSPHHDGDRSFQHPPCGRPCE